MRAIGRRSLLLGTLAAAAAACGRAHPALQQPVLDFTVAGRVRQSTTTRVQQTATKQGLTAAQHLAALTAAASAWWHPVLDAFNRSHRGLRATFGQYGIDPTDTAVPPGGPKGFGFTLNPFVSCQAGFPVAGPGEGVDLSLAIRDADLDTSAFLPGLLAATTDRHGAIGGIPIDFTILAMTYDTAELGKARLAPPPTSGWTIDQTVSAVSALAAAGAAFGVGLAGAGQGLPPPWLGFAEGYGGSVFGERVVLASGAVYEGLEAFAGILKFTWAGDRSAVGQNACLGLRALSLTVDDRPWPGQEIARFPRLPVPAVPADVLLAIVPTSAPSPGAGATFAVWLGSPQGQAALTALGYPAVRVDGRGGTAAFESAETGMRPADLRFLPGGMSGMIPIGGSTVERAPFDALIPAALVQPGPVRVDQLQALQDAMTGVLRATLTIPQAWAQLQQAGL